MTVTCFVVVNVAECAEIIIKDRRESVTEITINKLQKCLS